MALVDVSMPGWDGVRLARAMSGAFPSLKIIAVIRHDDGGFVKERLFGSASNHQMIAEQLGLDRQQVERATDEAMRKLGFTSRLQAMNYVRCRLNHDCSP